MQRQFASGSKQAPDPCDQFLEQAGFYRKHTARDASCLFRAISEQLYDTQMYHLEIRQICVDYMRKYKHVFQKSIERDIDEYLDDMSKPKTHGTLLELRACGYYYGRNIIIFEENTLGNWMIKEPEFVDIFRVFFNNDRHFDTVYTQEFIEDAAFCQALTYEILYKDVFKLPDVTYAVERMLHASSFENTKIITQYDGSYVKRILLNDGREFIFDRPEYTSCILDNYNLCHFHNPNYVQFAGNLQQKFNPANTNGTITQYQSQKNARIVDGLLPQKYSSCVRQLLDEGITPFPYKVAKALDPDIYRNIEFDAWSEMRKEQRFKNWYTGGNDFQIGVKCNVHLGGSQSDLYTCHIQDMSPDKGPCCVFIEELGEKRYVPYESLKPLPHDQVKPWSLPIRFQKHIERYARSAALHATGRGDVRKSSCLEMIPNGNCEPNCSGGAGDGIGIVNIKQRSKLIQGCSGGDYSLVSLKNGLFNETEMFSEKDDFVCKLKHFTSLHHFHPAHTDIIAMPLEQQRSHNNNHSDIKNSRRSSSGDNTLNSNTESQGHTNRSSRSNSGGDNQKSNTDREDEHDIDLIHQAESYSSCMYGYSEPYCPFTYDGGMFHSAAGTHGLVSASPYYYMYNTAAAAGAPGHMGPPPSSIHPANNSIATGIYLPTPIHNNSRSINYSGSVGSSGNVIQPSYYHPQSTGSSTLSVASSNTVTAIGGNRYPSGQISGRMIPKKSISMTGSDLPTDVSVLRFFYNLGCDYYMQTKENSNFTEMESSNNNSNNNNTNERKDFNKLALEFTNCVKIENDSSTSTQTQDSNNNTIVANTSSTAPNSRRFHSRYFNRRDKSNYKGGYNGGNSNNNSGGRYSTNNNSNNNYNKSYVPKTSNASNSGTVHSASNKVNSDLSEQNMQTNPAMTTSTSVVMGGNTDVDYLQNMNSIYNIPPPTNSTTAAGYTSYVSLYPGEAGDSSGIYMTQPQMMTFPYGVCPPTHPLNPRYQTYTATGPAMPHTLSYAAGTTTIAGNPNTTPAATLAHPPPPTAIPPNMQSTTSGAMQGTGATTMQMAAAHTAPQHAYYQGYDPSSTIMAPESYENAHFVMGYAPTPFYYTPATANGTAVATGPAAPLQQAYWYAPAPVPVPTTVPIAAATSTTAQPAASGGRMSVCGNEGNNSTTGAGGNCTETNGQQNFNSSIHSTNSTNLSNSE